MVAHTARAFRGYRFPAEVILWAVRWYLQFPISYRDLERALREMKRDGELWRFTRHRRGRWLNNLVEQDHRRIKRRTGPMLGFQSFGTARRTLAGVEAMAMLAKGQVRAVPANDMPAQRALVHQAFGLAV